MKNRADLLQAAMPATTVSPAEDELRNEVRCPPGGFTQGNSETNKIFSVHNQFDPALCCLPAQITYFKSQLSAITVVVEKKRGRPFPSAPSMQLFDVRHTASRFGGCC
jgi:hypothetical protein